MKKVEVLFKKNKIADAKYCDTFLSKTKGLMFSKRLKAKEGLILVADEESVLKTSIHTFFVFFPIDVLWVDNELKIVDIKRNIRPFSLLIPPKRKARYVVELPKNAAKNVRIGEKLLLRKIWK